MGADTFHGHTTAAPRQHKTTSAQQPILPPADWNSEHPTAGPLAVAANPIHMQSCSTTAAKAPPRLGEDSRTVLTDVLGLTPDEIDGLIKRGVVEAR